MKEVIGFLLIAIFWLIRLVMMLFSIAFEVTGLILCFQANVPLGFLSLVTPLAYVVGMIDLCTGNHLNLAQVIVQSWGNN